MRKLTLKEYYRLMGFPDDFKKVGTTAKQYHRLENSIVVPMAEEIAKPIKDQLFNPDYALNYKPQPKQMSLFNLAQL